ncbi:VWA domain-containing protein [Paracoccus sp. TOH]|uniref:VWA domain-containing protein n=1 Tax=Paracoccus sp. TOH TaxID=1263728 RepID=UPI0025B1F284|nr:VWA domain-containing protein [Paracoccus sp. TOH]WJS86844.1 VWA domain-containing protein [Paracoccus sp. TOH]
MILLRPWWLAALPLLALVAAWLWRRGPEAGGWQTVLPAPMLAGLAALGWLDAGGRLARMLPLAGAAALVLGLSGPALPRDDAPVFAQSDAVLLALDLSASVAGGAQAQGLKDAQAAAAQLIAGLAGRPVGLILYAREAYAAAAPTTDPQVLESLIAVLDPQTLPDKGSNPAAAMALAGQMLAGTERADLVLVSDGGGAGDPAALAEAERLRASGIGLWALTLRGERGLDEAGLRGLALEGLAPATTPQTVIAGLGRSGLATDPMLAGLRYRDLGPLVAALALLPLLIRFRRQS